MTTEQELADMTAWLETSQRDAEAAMKVFPAESRDGKRARIIYKYATRALEDLADLDAD